MRSPRHTRTARSTRSSATSHRSVSAAPSCTARRRPAQVVSRWFPVARTRNPPITIARASLADGHQRSSGLDSIRVAIISSPRSRRYQAG